MKRYRYVSPLRQLAWSDTLREAKTEAVAAGLASMEEWGGFYTDVFVHLETMETGREESRRSILPRVAPRPRPAS